MIGNVSSKLFKSAFPCLQTLACVRLPSASNILKAVYTVSRPLWLGVEIVGWMCVVCCLNNGACDAATAAETLHAAGNVTAGYTSRYEGKTSVSHTCGLQVMRHTLSPVDDQAQVTSDFLETEWTHATQRTMSENTWQRNVNIKPSTHRNNWI